MLGLIVLAVVAGVVATGGIQLGEVARISLLSAAFMAAVVFLGDRIARRLARAFRRLEPTQTRLLFALTLAFLMGGSPTSSGSPPSSARSRPGSS